jgi:uncharacterized membrane protein (DUF485 family)
MAHFDHGPESVPEPASARNTRYGLVLFTIYLLIYGGFVLLNAFAPLLMEVTPFAGVNLAILYGLGLIGAAILLAFLYGWLCRTPEAATIQQIREDAR